MSNLKKLNKYENLKLYDKKRQTIQHKEICEGIKFYIFTILFSRENSFLGEKNILEKKVVTLQ